MVASGCLSGATLQEFEEACSEIGCTAQQCNVNATVIANPRVPAIKPLVLKPSQKILSLIKPSASCNAGQAIACSANFISCSQGVSSLAQECACTSTLGHCLVSAGCLSGSALSDWEQACNDLGCTAAQCNVNSTAANRAPAIVPLVGKPSKAAQIVALAAKATVRAPSTCDEDAALLCVAGFAECIETASDMNGECVCTSTLGKCLLTSGCLAGTEINQFEEACEEIGCSVAQCTISSSPATKGSFPLPIEALRRLGMVPRDCDEYQALLCMADFGVCVNDNPQTCQCFQALGTCMNTAGCMAGGNCDQFKEACNELGCTTAQCNVCTDAPKIVVASKPIAALREVGILPQTCSDEEAVMCALQFAECDEASGSYLDCNCLHTAGLCLSAAGCLDSSTVGDFQFVCQEAGCTAAQCKISSRRFAQITRAAPPTPKFPLQFSASAMITGSNQRRGPEFIRWFYDSKKDRDRIDGLVDVSGQMMFAERFFLHQTETGYVLLYGGDSITCEKFKLNSTSHVPRPSFVNFTYVGESLVRGEPAYVWLDHQDPEFAVTYFESKMSAEPMKWVVTNRRNFQYHAVDLFEWDTGSQDSSLWQLPQTILQTCNSRQ